MKDMAIIALILLVLWISLVLIFTSAAEQIAQLIGSAWIGWTLVHEATA